MKRKNTLGFILTIFLISMTLGYNTARAYAAPSETIQSVKVQGAVENRLYGQNRFQTAKAISEQMNSGTVQDVIMTSGNNFPDALSASVLAKKLNAPILLVDNKVSDSNEAINYISQHLDKTGTVHIIGGIGIVGKEFESTLQQLGYINIDRIGGNDRYDTDTLIAQKLSVPKNTPVVIASGENFPDALSISSIAASKGYPILLVSSDGMTQGIQDFITTDQPSQVYITGGTGVVSDSVQTQIQSLAPSTTITRLSGYNRFQTAAQILNTFSISPSPKTLYLASGNDFPDALAGSALASINGDPIVLLDSNSFTVSYDMYTYLTKFQNASIKPEIKVLGGTGALSDMLVQNAESLVNGKAQATPTTQKLVELGFESLGPNGAFYNSAFPGYRIGADLTVGIVQPSLGDPGYVTFNLANWDGKVPSLTLSALNLIFPDGADPICSRINELSISNPDTVNEEYQIAGHKVTMQTGESGTLYVVIWDMNI